MGTKTISLADDAYEKLKQHKRDGESFSDVVRRLAGGVTLSEYHGVLSETRSRNSRPSSNGGEPTVLVSALTVMELYEGVQLADTSDAERSAVESLLAEIESVPFDSECAIRAGQLLAELSEAGEPIDETDVMIAATALVHERPVVTRNVDHFERVPDLDVVSY